MELRIRHSPIVLSAVAAAVVVAGMVAGLQPAATPTDAPAVVADPPTGDAPQHPDDTKWD